MCAIALLLVAAFGYAFAYHVASWAIRDYAGSQSAGAEVVGIEGARQVFVLKPSNNDNTEIVLSQDCQFRAGIGVRGDNRGKDAIRVWWTHAVPIAPRERAKISEPRVSLFQCVRSNEQSGPRSKLNGRRLAKVAVADSPIHSAISSKSVSGHRDASTALFWNDVQSPHVGLLVGQELLPSQVKSILSSFSGNRGSRRLLLHLNQGLSKDSILIENNDSREDRGDHQGAVKPQLKFAMATICALFCGALYSLFLSRSLDQDRTVRTIGHLSLSFGFFCLAAAVYWAQKVWFEQWL